MSKLCVLVTGLAALAPPTAADAKARVLLRAVGAGVSVGGTAIPPHVAAVRYRIAAGQLDTAVAGGATVAFTPAGGAPAVNNPEQFMPVGSLTGALPLQAAYRNGGAAPPALAASLELTGGTISPVQIDDLYNLDELSRTITSELTATQPLGSNQPPTLLTTPRTVANGLLYELELAAGAAAPAIVIGGAASALAPEPLADLGLFAAEQGDVYVVWATNLPVVTGAAGATPVVKRAGEQPVPAMRATSGTVGDADFDLLYDFVDATAATERLVPWTLVDAGAPGNPPGRCMVGITT